VHPKELLNHACIRHRFASGVMHPWEFERDGEIVKITPNARVIANSIDLEISAAVQGLGLIATFEGFVAPHVKSGALESVLDEWLAPFSGPFLYYASRRHMPAPLRAFVDFIKRRTGGDVATTVFFG
jgi:DNA-binding transcriptional LysR family regulator